jgi:AcrR family transcriptional regulator
MVAKRSEPRPKARAPSPGHVEPDRRAPSTATRATEAPAHTPAPTTRERILATALDVFAEMGFEGTTTREICARASVNGAALNYHWRSKEQLWQAAIERCGGVFRKVISSIDLSRGADEVIPAFLTALFDELVVDPRPVRLVAWAALQPERMDYDGTARALRPLVDLANGYLLQQKALGRVAASVDVEVVVPLVQGMLIYTFINRPGLRRHFGKDFTDPAHAARFRDELVAATLTLLGIEPAGPPRKRRPR